MSDTVIKAENIGKRYVLNHLSSGGYRRFSDTLMHLAKAPARWLSKKASPDAPSTTEEFWALQDVSFEIKRGEVVGIIGRNGAGKSTLLKILSRITEPTNGRIRLRGRVASLLEVGTGFHPELTGRENIFLNGAILGMRREEIKAKFDEIVAFAEIERFLDTPVKRYSSGMYVRLAFAVAAHLEPEILIVDEVLAVGDQKFQQKCLGKMNEVASVGRTILLVSHNLAVVASLCNKAILLAGGKVTAAGAADEVLRVYADGDRSGKPSTAVVNRRIDDTLQIASLRCSPEAVSSSGAMRIVLTLHATQNAQIEELCLLIYSGSGQRISIIDLRKPSSGTSIPKGHSATWSIDVEALPLVDGDYSLGLYCRSAESRGDHYELCHFSIYPGHTSCLTLPYEAQHRGCTELEYRFVSEAPMTAV